MSVSIATMGMFGECCRGGIGVGGGGAVPTYRDEQEVKPTVFITKVDMVTLNSIDGLVEKIKVRLVSKD